MSVPRSLLGNDKLSFMLDQLECTSNVRGDIVEAGVYLGGSLYAMAQHAKDWSSKKLYGYDTFSGLPFSENTYMVEGRFKSDHGEVVKLFKDAGFNNVTLIKGLYPDTNENSLVSFAHLDMDLYIPTANALKNLDPIMNIGGIIVLDDYNWIETPGISKAVKNFLATTENFQIKAYNTYQIALEKVK